MLREEKACVVHCAYTVCNTIAACSNNSVYASLGMDYEAIASRIRGNGEPGFAWLENMRR